MLEIYQSKVQPTTGRVVADLLTLDQIEPDCWVNLASPTEEELLTVERALQIPSEFLRYPLDEEERPRIDLDDDTQHVLIIIDFPYVRREGGNIKYETQPMGIVLAGKCIVTVSLRESAILDAFRENRVRDFVTGYRTRFVFQIMFAGAKEYLKLLRFIDKTIETAEHQLTKSISNKELFKLMQLGKSLVYFSTSLKSNESVLEKLMRGKFLKQYEEDQDYLEDVMIENKQALDMADIYASIINGTMDAYASIISNNLNVVMKFMAAMTIVLSFPQMFYAFFGQNFAFPWQTEFASEPWPFIGVLVISLAVTALVAWWLYKRDMF